MLKSTRPVLKKSTHYVSISLRYAGSWPVWLREKSSDKKSPTATVLIILGIKTQPNLTTLSRAMLSMPYVCGGLSGPTLSPIFDVYDF